MPHSQPVLLIEDDEDYERLVREVLRGSETFEVRSAPNLVAGLSLIDQVSPAVILVDLNLADSSGYETFVRVRDHAQRIPIIVLTGLADDQTAVQANQAGAQDHLVKGLTHPKLIARCINMAISRQSFRPPTPKTSSAPGIVLSFIGSKGGVGTSTTAMNVAALLAQSGFDTIAVELQSGRTGTFSLYLESEPRDDLHSLCQKPADSITASDLRPSVLGAVSNLRLLCATAPDGAWSTLGAEHVRAIVGAARRRSRFVVLDLPARMDESVAQALDLSDSITMIVDRESASVHCNTAWMRQLKAANPHATGVGVAIVDRTGLDPPLQLADIKARLNVRPRVMIPSAAAAIALSQSARTPLVLLYPDDPFSLAHFELAERLLPPAAEGLCEGRTLLTGRAAAWRTIPESMYG